MDDASLVPQVLFATLQKVSAKFEQRPAGQAIKYVLNILCIHSLN